MPIECKDAGTCSGVDGAVVLISLMCQRNTQAAKRDGENCFGISMIAAKLGIILGGGGGKVMGGVGIGFHWLQLPIVV